MTNHLALDQSAGPLTLHTGRSGVGSKVGHDLTLQVGTWTANAMLDGSGAVTAVRFIASLRSLEVLRGDGGLKPLSDKDKRTILDNAAQTLKAASDPELVFTATDLNVVEGTTTIVGEASLAGQTQPLTVELTVTRSGSQANVSARAEVVQSHFGIKPYSGMLGALKVRDMVEVRAELAVKMG